MDKQKKMLLFLGLPFIAFAAMIIQGVIGASAPRIALPIQGFDPRDILYGHYINVRISTEMLHNIQNKCACVKPLAATEKPGTQNAIYYSACAEINRDACVAVIDSSNQGHIKALSEPVRIYIEETMGPELDNMLRKEPQRLTLSASITGSGFIYHGLNIDGQPIKSLYAPDPFNTQSWGR